MQGVSNGRGRVFLGVFSFWLVAHLWLGSGSVRWKVLGCFGDLFSSVCFTKEFEEEVRFVVGGEFIPTWVAGLIEGVRLEGIAFI